MRDAVLSSWSFDPWLAMVLVAMAVIYLRGAVSWRTRSLRRGCSPARIACYFGGLAAIWTALASPLEAFAPLMLSAHMGQHMLLTMAAAPLILLGEPFLPLLRGLPAVVRREWLGPFIASRSLRRVGRRAVHPVCTWIAFNLVLVAWHVPALYELALRDPFWHRVEHLSLFGGALLLWWPVVLPFPSRAWWPRWAMVPYLLAADIVNTIIAASFAFATGVIYETYATTAPAVGVDALRDQAAAGGLMWVPGSIAYLVPAAFILLKVMRPKAWSRDRRVKPAMVTRRSTTISLPQLAPRPRERFDLLRAPVIGAVLARRGARTALRAIMLLAAIAIVIDGFVGPREAPMNLAGTLPWTHWRGAAVLLLLIGGNFLCMTCPFMLPRILGDRWQRWRSARAREIRGAPGSTNRRGTIGVVVGTALGGASAVLERVASATPMRLMRRRGWPKVLRNKWTAVALVATWLIVYEAFDLWASPMATAWVIVGYFVAAFVVDAAARGGAFCKWVCPLGQFHFAQSTMSPLTVAVRDPGVCSACTTHDCLKGNPRQRGCELDLFVPRKQGNLDCTFCLDCADACPHDNVGILTQSIGGELRSDRWRSSLGALSRRIDVAALLLVLAAGSIANAAGMTAPVLSVIADIGRRIEWPRPSIAVMAVVLMLAIPFSIAFGMALISGGRRWREAFTAIAIAASPLGAAVWLVHFAFHFVTSWSTAGPVIIRAAGDLGVTNQDPEWSNACCTHAPEWLLPMNLLLLSLGVSISLWTLVRRTGGPAPASLRSWLPGAMFIVLMWAAAAWVFFQPMDMRGTLGFEVTP